MNTVSRELSRSTCSALDGESIWIVQGTTGDYSDRIEWVVFAFRTEAQAQAYVEMLDRERQKIDIDRWDLERRQLVKDAMRKFDPLFSEDDTGTRWFISETRLLSSANPEVSEDSRDEQQ